MKRLSRNWHLVRRARLLFGTVGCAVLIPCVGASVAAQDAELNGSTEADRVVIQPAGSAGRVARVGTVLDYTSEKLHFREVGGGAIRVFEAAEIISVDTPRTAAHVRAISEFRLNQFDEAEASFNEALASEQRAWVRRDLLASLVRCRVIEGDYRGAGEYYLKMIRSQVLCRHVGLIPLVWAPSLIDPETQRTARIWMADSNDFARLLGASLLLADPSSGALALSVLEDLSANSDRRIQWLARGQRWRAALQGRPPSDFAIEDWRQTIEAMPRELRAGPYYVLGRGYWMRREYDQSALCLLRVALVYHDDHQLAARAYLEAADALIEAGRPDDAELAYREIQTKYAHTPFAADALAALQSGLRRQGERNSPE